MSKGKLIRVSDEVHGELCTLQANKIEIEKKRVTMNNVITDLIGIRKNILQRGDN